MKLQDRFMYPAVFDYEDAETGIHVEFPDFEGCFTSGRDEAEALEMARERLAIEIVDYENEGKELPKPSLLVSIQKEEQQAVILVDVFMPPYRDEFAEKATKTTITLPKWLKDLAEQKKVNYSRLLQDSLKNYLGVKDRKDVHDQDRR
jgi:predicted RNase H-like HicB family nuclease